MTTSPTEPTDPAGTSPSGLPTKPPRTPGGGPSTGSLTRTGVVTAGVEPGCLLLDDYLLVGGPQDVLRPGARVTVVGRVQADMMTTCQQGTPFVVEEAKPA